MTGFGATIAKENYDKGVINTLSLFLRSGTTEKELLDKGFSKDYIEKAKELAQLTEADGGILFAHWGCKGTIGASGLIKNSLEASGLPTIILDGDGCNPANTSDGQVSTRIQAYMEMLKEAKSHDTLCL